MKWILSGLLTLLLCSLAACADGGDPAKTIEDYLRAKVAGDAGRLAGLLCAAMESQLPIEAGSFANVEATIEGMACTRGEKDGDYTIVTCEGQIVATYGAENRNFPLGRFRTLQEDGVWKMCGAA